jgi:hypothetical protein
VFITAVPTIKQFACGVWGFFDIQQQVRGRTHKVTRCIGDVHNWARSCQQQSLNYRGSQINFTIVTICRFRIQWRAEGKTLRDITVFCAQGI